MSQLVSAATSLRTSPPPAIAAALAAQSRDDLQRCGRVTSQLRQVVKELQECGDSWGRLAASSLDADAATLAQLAVLQQAMVSLARLLLFYYSVLHPDPQGSSLETSIWFLFEDRVWFFSCLYWYGTEVPRSYCRARVFVRKFGFP
jgi:hypothetical protein